MSYESFLRQALEGDAGHRGVIDRPLEEALAHLAAHSRVVLDDVSWKRNSIESFVQDGHRVFEAIGRGEVIVNCDSHCERLSLMGQGLFAGEKSSRKSIQQIDFRLNSGEIPGEVAVQRFRTLLIVDDAYFMECCDHRRQVNELSDPYLTVF